MSFLSNLIGGGLPMPPIPGIGGGGGLPGLPNIPGLPGLSGISGLGGGQSQGGQSQGGGLISSPSPIDQSGDLGYPQNLANLIQMLGGSQATQNQNIIGGGGLI